MPTDTRQANEGLESLRIARPKEQPRRKRNPLLPIAVSALVAVVIGILAYLLYVRTVGRPPTVQTIVVMSSRQSESSVLLTGSGYIVTRHKYITIGTKILGQIVDEPIEEGQHIKTGDVLARIDDRDYQAELRQAIAIRELAEANVRLKSSRADRARMLNGTGAISTDYFETAVNESEVAAAELKRDKAAVDFAQFNVNQCVITSPITGIVLKKYRELGDTINFGGEVQTGGGATDIAQLADTSDMRAEVDINEADISKVSIGSPATIVPDAYADQKFSASLVKIYPEADRQKGTVKVEVHIENPDLRIIKPEMSVKVIFLESKPAATEKSKMTIPKSSIKSDGSGSFVWTVQDDMARRVPIVVGREIETGVEVTKGLNDGEIVILAPPENVTDGKKVTTEQAR